MSYNITTPNHVISAICHLTDNRELPEEDRKDYIEFEKNHPLDHFTIKGEIISRLTTTSDLAEQDWPDYQVKLRQALSVTALPATTIPRRRYIKPIIWSCAACLALVGSLLLYYYFKVSLPPGSQPGDQNQQLAALTPKPPRATLILGGNKTINLEEVKNGWSNQQGGINVIKQAPDSLSYEPFSNPETGVYMNTLVLQRAGTYKVRLSDGTLVRLNAQSSITFPSSFTGPVREVTLTGEAYFEVAKTNKPFIVKQNDNKIEVLGTRFNISAYPEENKVKTTLLEGSVRIITPGQTPRMLMPGQQAIIQENATGIDIKEIANPEQAVSWVDGNFSFERLPLREIMYQVQRWYDVQVIYEEKPDPSPITVTKISRGLSLTEFLDALKEGDRFSYRVSVDNKHVFITK
ncbi:DUF4974 domain-containing protein [Pseudoflavitalea sp. X16]|uniref:FecR family protein n=1 Tax=Paraflavitalea devenefica TaxID=2716334 RepID=UPI00141E990B|nr:FecR domain-containing protein [Paraflavitalea devenefica]NII27774.1 DUF4974 domain-containing protein [Paraflavitalea devenefica]